MFIDTSSVSLRLPPSPTGEGFLFCYFCTLAKLLFEFRFFRQIKIPRRCRGICFSLFILLYRLEISCTMLAKRADIVCGKLLALVDISADLADVSLLSCRFGLGLHIFVVVIVCHGRLVAHHACLRHRADKHSV